MIGWIALVDTRNIHPVLCWAVSGDDGTSPIPVLSTWVCFQPDAIPVDTEAELVALLLQGYTLMPFNSRTQPVIRLLRKRYEMQKIWMGER